MNSVFSTALFQLLPLAVAWKFGPDLVWLLSAALLARVIGAFGLFWHCWQDLLRGQRIVPHRSEIMTLLTYGGWVNLAAIFGPVLYMIDRFVIGALLGATAVTNYTVPIQLSSRLSILPGALIAALFPRLSGAHPEERRVLSERAMLTLAGLLASPFIGAVFVIGPFLQLWVGGRVGPEAQIIGRYTAAAMFANALALVSYTRLQASGRPDLVTKILLIEIPPYLLLLYLGIHFLGMTGAALATSIRYFADFLLLTWVAGVPAHGRGRLALTFGLLVLSVWFAGLWTFTDWRWWVSGGVLISAGTVLGLLTIPANIRQQLIVRARGWLGFAPVALASQDRE
jgi:O-antigen/teichoic acid export membrane protein